MAEVIVTPDQVEKSAAVAAGSSSAPTPTELEFDAPTLDDRTLTPFLSELVPPTAHLLPARETIVLSRTSADIHPNLPALPAWGYGVQGKAASVPGPALEVTAGDSVEITWRNRIGPPGPLPFQAWMTTVENSQDSPQNELGTSGASAGAPRDLSMVPAGWAVTHLHGGHTRADSDGWPDNMMGADGRQLCCYDNTSDNADLGLNKVGAMNWYHDHAMGGTGPHIYAGLAGPYIIRHPLEQALGLPVCTQTGESILMLADRNLVEDPDGRVRFLHKNTPDTAEFFGPLTLVGGKLWPRMMVGAGVVRLRIFNASNARTYRLHLLESTGEPLKVGKALIIGTDAGLLWKAQPLDMGQGVTLASAERIDLLLDLSGLDGTHLYLVNSAEAPFDDGPRPPDLGKPHRDLRLPYPQVMRLDVERHSPAAPDPDLWAKVQRTTLNPWFRRLVRKTAGSPAPAPASDQPDVLELPDDRGHQTVLLVEQPPGHLQLVEIERNESGKIELRLPDEAGPLRYSPIAVMSGDQMGGFYQKIGIFPAVGRWEVWRFLNTTVDVHPIHIHQSVFQPLEDAATSYNVSVFNPEALETSGPLVPGAPGRAFDSRERFGWKDTIRVNPGNLVTIAIRFDIPGEYVYHCHILEHEDNEMMRPFVVTPLPMPRVGVSNAASHDTEVSPVVQALPKRSIL